MVLTVSARRIAQAYDFFNQKLSGKEEGYLVDMLKAVTEASCTTHPVSEESEAIQMFIFQNNRGKTPSNLEVIKAQFMYQAHLNGAGDADAIIKDIKARFENIYRSIASIEGFIGEDEVLNHTYRVYKNTLGESGTQAKIQQELQKTNPIAFIETFTQYLEDSFQILQTFFSEHEKANLDIHSLVVLRGYGIALPFILKAYRAKVGLDQIGRLSKALESLVLRQRVIGTRANMTTRLQTGFVSFEGTENHIDKLVNWVEELKKEPEGWWAYWNDQRFVDALQGRIHPPTARFLLWKYENHLRSQKGIAGYGPIRFSHIEQPELEHIAPWKKPKKRSHGYGPYNQQFWDLYIDCLGNYLLLSKPHNGGVSNKPFPEKHKTYTYLEQQKEIQEMVPATGKWGKDLIQHRKDKIIQFILATF